MALTELEAADAEIRELHAALTKLKDELKRTNEELDKSQREATRRESMHESLMLASE